MIHWCVRGGRKGRGQLSAQGRPTRKPARSAVFAGLAAVLDSSPGNVGGRESRAAKHSRLPPALLHRTCTHVRCPFCLKPSSSLALSSWFSLVSCSSTPPQARTGSSGVSWGGRGGIARLGVGQKRLSHLGGGEVEEDEDQTKAEPAGTVKSAD